MRILFIFLLLSLPIGLMAEPPAASLGTPRASKLPHGTAHFGLNPTPSADDEVCKNNLQAEFDDQLLNRLIGVMISPAHYHTGSAAMAREFLRDAASRDPKLADRILKFSLSAYDLTQKEFPGAETGDILQLVSEVTGYLPDGHPLKNPEEVASQLQRHALDWVTVSLQNVANKKLLKASQLPPSLLNIISGYSKSLDRLSPQARERALENFIAELKAKGMGEAEGFLLQPLARHFGKAQLDSALKKWSESPDSISAMALLASTVSESSDPKVALAARVFLEANRSETMKRLKGGVEQRVAEEKKGIEKSAKEVRALNREIIELSIGLGLDMAGIIDPSPLCSALSSGYCIYREMKADNPDYILVTLSLVGMLPALGKLGLGIKVGRQMEKLITMTRKAKVLIESIMSSRRLLQQSLQASDFLDYAVKVIGKTVDHQLHAQAKKIPLPARIGLENFTGLPLTSEKGEPFAAAYIQSAIDESLIGKKAKETCSAFDRRVKKVKELLSIPGKKIRALVQGNEPSLAKPQTSFATERGVTTPNYDPWLADELRAKWTK